MTFRSSYFRHLTDNCWLRGGVFQDFDLCVCCLFIFMRATFSDLVSILINVVMLSFNDLPIILVSACNASTTKTVISDLIDSEVADDAYQGESDADRVWRISNKYYTADVRLHALVDGETLKVDPDLIEAHVIYLTDDEVDNDPEAWQRRAATARACASEVNLVLASTALDRVALPYESVALRAAAAGGDEDEDEGQRGWARAREALHAHVWRGLCRTPPAPHTPAEAGVAGGAGGDDAFAALLRQLPEAGRRARGLEDAERRAQAESVMAAFFNALAADLDLEPRPLDY